MKSSILIIGHPNPQNIEFGADFVKDKEVGLLEVRAHQYPVVVLETDDEEPTMDFLIELRKSSALSQVILVSSKYPPGLLQKLVNQIGVFKIISSFDGDSLQNAVREALEEFALIKQNQSLLLLIQDQNKKLQQLTNLLDEKVKAREKYLNEVRENLMSATLKSEVLNRALVAIQKGLTKRDIEINLAEALKSTMNLTWVKILFKEESFVTHVMPEEQSSLSLFSAPLFREKELLGHIYFSRKSPNTFSQEEDDFLLQIGDAVALAVDRLKTLSQLESLKQEWEVTFDSITDPVSLVGRDYRILRANKAFINKAPRPQVINQFCYQVLFSKDKPCEGCILGRSFELGEVNLSNGESAHYQVSSHRVLLEDFGEAFAMLYRDTSEEYRLRMQLLESSKMAEIGTIGGSIAHEINNPLGGMIAFLQILKSELKPGDPIAEDVLEMEKSAQRCKSIVESLLAFTRLSSGNQKLPVNLSELISLALNIIELQSRGLGIQLNKSIQDKNASTLMDKNQLVQVLVNVLQNSCESLADKLARRPLHYKPEINIEAQPAEKKPGYYLIRIRDNGEGISTKDLPRVFTPFFSTKDKTRNSGLGLTVAYQIVKEHGGEMEISSVPGESTVVNVVLPLHQRTSL